MAPDEGDARGTRRPGDDSFEDALGRLADVVAGLESGSLGLSASIDAYERGVAILKRLHEELAAAEERVRVLVRIDEQGRPVLGDAVPDGPRPPAAGDGVAADPAQTAEPRGPARGGRARNQRSRPLPGMDDAREPP